MTRHLSRGLSPLLALATLLAAAPAAQGLPPGWRASFATEEGTTVTHAASAAFALEPGQRPHRALPPGGPFEALYLGVLGLQESGRYRFGVEVEGGEALLWVEDGTGSDLAEVAAAAPGTRWTEWVDLGADDLRVGVRFQGGGAGRARLRALWELAFEDDRGFRAEPIPARRVAVPEELAGEVYEGLAVERGARLLVSKGCTACHAGADDLLGRRTAPDLATVGERAGEAWLGRWLLDPAAVRPGSDMPHLPLVNEMFAGLFAGMLSSFRGADEPVADAPDEELLQRGRDLYHRVGCVACHGALVPPAELLHDPFFPQELPGGPVAAPLGDLRGKWSAGALAAFLEDPVSAYPDGRMPAMDLDAAEARALAAYLAAELGPRPAPTQPPADAARRARGQGLLADSGCLACHAFGDAPRVRPPAPALAALDPERGCLDPHDARTPRYDLAPEERAELAGALAAVPGWRSPDAPPHRAEDLFAANACGACHARSGAGGPQGDLRLYFASEGDDVDLGDEGRFPPDLGGAGTKLTTAWMEAVLAGEGRARPYLATRMPVFGDEVRTLAEDLGRADGVRPRSDREWPPVDDRRVEIGHGVMGRTALGCVACHVYADYPPSGTVGLDLTRFTERLRYEWYAAFVQDPARYEPGTRMPAFGRGGRSTLRDVLDGDLHAQADAMWAYFSLGEFMPVPEGVELAAKLPVAVGERPLVLRTFLEDVGARAIAVGYPEGIHLGFDAETCRLSAVWQGAFLDAAGAWAGRGGTSAGGRGPTVWSLPDLEPPADVAFRGYHLLADGRPRFEYSVGTARVTEEFAPRRLPRPVLGRELVVAGAPPEGVPLAAGPDAALVAIEGGRLVGPDGAELAAGAELPADRPCRIVPNADAPMRVELEVSL